MQKILLVEDNREIQLIVTKSLPAFLVTQVTTLAAAKKVLDDENFALLLLDIELPDGDGIHFSSVLKEDERFKRLPTIILTGKQELGQKIAAFRLGVDDYVVKPFEPLELRARVTARIEKAEQFMSDNDSRRIQDIVISQSQQKAWIAKDTALLPISLTSLEFRLLWMFTRHPDQVHSREKILDGIWGQETHVTDRTVDSHISHLRKKLTDSKLTIDSVFGEGYRLSTKA